MTRPVSDAHDNAGQLGDGVNPFRMTNPHSATPVTVVAGP
jgi:hypothetical protein